MNLIYYDAHIIFLHWVFLSFDKLFILIIIQMILHKKMLKH